MIPSEDSFSILHINIAWQFFKISLGFFLPKIPWILSTKDLFRIIITEDPFRFF